MALYDWVAKLKMKYPQAEILGHRDISPDTNHNGIVDPWEYIKACPCFNVREEYAELNKI
jgi:N-acetylmuramoyl-L-alanine amidase